jgi:DNA-binding transcriptional LysR family regulator
MHKISIDALDLNLLVVLQALLKEHSVTRAAARIGLSQSATSHALGRLREFFQDPILVRTPKGMVPTLRAEELREPLERILRDLDQMIQPSLFDPATAQGKIHIASSDYSTVVILPIVLKQLTQIAPQVEVECHHWQPDIIEFFRNGSIDLGLGVIDVSELSDMRAQTLFDEDFVAVVRSNHPILARDNLTLDHYISLSHALITISNFPGNAMINSFKSHVDLALAELGLKRRVVLQIPQFLAAPFVVAQTDLILTLPRRIAVLVADTANLAILEIPIQIEKFSYQQIWHERRSYDPLQRWFRDLVATQSQCL